MAEEYNAVRTDMPVEVYYELVITNGKNSYLVDPCDGVKLTRTRRCVPAKLQFGVLKDDVLNFTEGNRVQFKVNNTIVFQGFVFEKERTKNEIIKVTAYDQLRYFKNKDCYVYGGITATELLRNICNDYGLTIGDLANTVYKIPNNPPRIERDKTLMDIILYALDQTVINTPNHDLYNVYDDAGKIMLKHINDMKLDIYIDGETSVDYSHKTSIDKDTYDVVKVVREVPDGERKKLVKTGIVADDKHIEEWGRLQYLLLPSDKQINAIERAKRILELKNRKTRDIRLRGVIGDVRVRGGSLVFVDLNIGDVALKNYIMVDSVEHIFSEGIHMMDLDLFYVEKSGASEVKYDKDAQAYQQIQQAKQTREVATNGMSTGQTGINGNQVDTAFAMNDGRVSPYGSVGCVDTVTAVGSYYSEDLKDAYNKGIVNVDDLCADMSAKGHAIERFNGYANKGDILVYGNRDHVVIADGHGGCFGNSSSAGRAIKYSDANYAWGNGEPPTEIIRMG